MGTRWRTARRADRAEKICRLVGVVLGIMGLFWRWGGIDIEVLLLFASRKRREGRHFYCGCMPMAGEVLQ